MTCGAIGWRSWPTRTPGWRAGVPDRENRIAECPLPCCRKVKRGARTPMPGGARRCRSALMSTARAKRHQSRERGAGMTPTKPTLPDPRLGGASCPWSNPMACRIKQQRRRACLTARPVLSQAGGFGQVDAEAVATALVAVSHPQRRTAPEECQYCTGAAASSHPPCRGRQRRELGTPTSLGRIDERRRHRTISVMKGTYPSHGTFSA